MTPETRPPTVRLTSTEGVVVTLTPDGIGWVEKDGDGAMLFPWTVAGGLQTAAPGAVGPGGNQVLGLGGSVLGTIRGGYGGLLTPWIWLPLVVATYLPERYVATETDAVGGLPGAHPSRGRY